MPLGSWCRVMPKNAKTTQHGPRNDWLTESMVLDSGCFDGCMEDELTDWVRLLSSKFVRFLQLVDRRHVRKVTSTFETSRPTWVSVQDVVLNKLRPSTQPSQPLPELSHFYHNTQETRCLLMSLRFLLVCHSLTQNRCGVAS